ncbi:hypothetical protein LUZ60_009303 [Juncus effusus]|nr:hypothetical protein LUZ60_009303 [Juncus effusus]
MDNKLSLKLLIDTKFNRVLFAEAGKEVIDFLFSLLALPVGTIIKLLSKEQMVGSIGGLYSSLEHLEESYLLSTSKKSSLLNPPVFSTPISKNTLLLPPASPVTSKKFYRCSNTYINHVSYVTDIYGTVCPNCTSKMTTEMKYVGLKKEEEKEEGGEGFVRGVVTYSIMDDLSVVPMSTISSITILNKFQIKDLGSLQENTVSTGIDEGMKLLKASLESKNVLITVFLRKKQAM